MLKKIGTLSLMVLLVASLGACSVEQEQEGELPEVSVEGGQLPEYDVDTADVDVSMETVTATVPEVTTETTAVSVPDVDVTTPSETPQP